MNSFPPALRLHLLTCRLVSARRRVSVSRWLLQPLEGDADLKPRFLLSYFCAITYMLHVPSACAVGSGEYGLCTGLCLLMCISCRVVFLTEEEELSLCVMNNSCLYPLVRAENYS